MFASLRIAPKLALSAVVFLVPTVFGLGMLVAEQNIQIDFAAQEAIGARYLHGVADIQGRAALASLNRSGIQAEWKAALAKLE